MANLIKQQLTEDKKAYKKEYDDGHWEITSPSIKLVEILIRKGVITEDDFKV